MAQHQQASQDHASADAEPWAYLRPIAALPPPGRFSDDASAELLLLDFKLFSDVLLYADRIHVAVATHERYSSERAVLLAMLTPESMEGCVGTAVVNEGVFNTTAPLRAALNDLCESSFKHNIEDAANGFDLLQKLVEAINAKTGTALSVAPIQPVKGEHPIASDH